MVVIGYRGRPHSGTASEPFLKGATSRFTSQSQISKEKKTRTGPAQQRQTRQWLRKKEDPPGEKGDGADLYSLHLPS